MSTVLNGDAALRDLAEAKGLHPRWFVLAGVKQTGGIAFEFGAIR